MPKDMIEAYLVGFKGLTPNHKAGLIGGLVVGSCTIFWAGWGAKTFFGNEELEKATIQYERSISLWADKNRILAQQMGDVKTENQKFQEALKNITDSHLPNSVAPLEKIPLLDDAPFDETSAKDMGANWFSHHAHHHSMTTINAPPFYEKFAGRKFKWEGVLVDVLNEGDEICAVLEVMTHRTLPNDTQEVNGKWQTIAIFREYPFGFRCYFFDEAAYLNQLKTFTPRHHTLTVMGVMDEYGNLRRCKIERIQDGVPQSLWDKDQAPVSHNPFTEEGQKPTFIE